MRNKITIFAKQDMKRFIKIGHLKFLKWSLHEGCDYLIGGVLISMSNAFSV